MRGEDILSTEPNAKLVSITVGYVSKCDSSSGICFNIVDQKYGSSGVHGTFLKFKPRLKFHFDYISKHYRNDHMNEFSRIECYLPNGEMVFVNDCHSGHGHCSHLETMRIAELFNKYRGQIYRKSSKTTSKIIAKKRK
jgi:hypothetical protein